HAASPAESTAVLDVRQCHQLSTAEMNAARDAEHFSRSNRDLPRGTGPDRLHKLESAGAMLGIDGAYGPEARVAASDVVDARSGQMAAPRILLLLQREHVDLVALGQTRDQRQQRRDHPVLARPVDASRHY